MDNNYIFEENYARYIKPIYGKSENYPNNTLLLANNTIPHEYSIPSDQRVDMTKYETYTIDPNGCVDADDAFSIYNEGDCMFLAIHIADPTEHIQLGSDLWNDIVNRTTTKYPSNRKPIHMMPMEILEPTSLMIVNEYVNQDIHIQKQAITILTQIDHNTFEPIGNIELLFTNILIKSRNAFCYHDASLEINHIYAFKIGFEISKTLQYIRGQSTKGIVLNEISTGYPVYTHEGVHLYKDTENEKNMKQMIAEFAIFANSFIGEYLKIHLNTGIFRTCDTNDLLHTINHNITGEELLQSIITNGIRAEYISNIKPHDLVGKSEYCHFTSPIRRLSDCICHYLLKYIHLRKINTEIKIPFDEDELDILASKCAIVNKKDKQHQYLDIKFRLLHVMYNMLLHKPYITIKYYITSYVNNLYLNIIICEIDNINVHMSYTLRSSNYRGEVNHQIQSSLTITHVNCFTKYDQNTIPELDKHIFNKSI
jgi:exoribonuclease R